MSDAISYGSAQSNEQTHYRPLLRVIGAYLDRASGMVSIGSLGELGFVFVYGCRNGIGDLLLSSSLAHGPKSMIRVPFWGRGMIGGAVGGIIGRLMIAEFGMRATSYIFLAAMTGLIGAVWFYVFRRSQPIASWPVQ